MAAVIERATRDALGSNPAHREDARRYFASETYEDHVTDLGLPPDILPVGVEEFADGDS